MVQWNTQLRSVMLLDLEHAYHAQQVIHKMKKIKQIVRYAILAHLSSAIFSVIHVQRGSIKMKRAKIIVKNVLEVEVVGTEQVNVLHVLLEIMLIMMSAVNRAPVDFTKNNMEATRANLVLNLGPTRMLMIITKKIGRHIIIRLMKNSSTAMFVRLVMKVAQIIQLVIQALFAPRGKESPWALVSLAILAGEILTRTKQITNI